MLNSREEIMIAIDDVLEDMAITEGLERAK
jgi:hypothetical protein